MIRPEIQNFIDYLYKNKDLFEYKEITGGANRGVYVDGCSNNIYDVTYFYIRDNINDVSIDLEEDEGIEITMLINIIKERDIDMQKKAKENLLLKWLSRL